MEPDVTAEETQMLVALLRRTMEVKAGEVEIPVGIERIATPRRQRPWMAMAACAVAAVAAGSLLGYRAIAPDERDRAVGKTPSTSSPDDVAADEAIQWYLPEQIPNNYVLTDVRGTSAGVLMTLTPVGPGRGHASHRRPQRPGTRRRLKLTKWRRSTVTTTSSAKGTSPSAVASVQGEVSAPSRQRLRPGDGAGGGDEHPSGVARRSS